MGSKKIKIILLALVLVAALGVADSVYLTKKHYTQEYTCSLLDINSCESVLSSSYSSIFNLPIALLGSLYYLLIFISAGLLLKKENKISQLVLLFVPVLAFLFSLYLVYLQLFVLKSICQYCMLSAVTSTVIFILSLIFSQSKKELAKNKAPLTEN